jgi:hypothetical protein
MQQAGGLSSREGTVDCDLVETTPVVFRIRLTRHVSSSIDG